MTIEAIMVWSLALYEAIGHSEAIMTLRPARWKADDLAYGARSRVKITASALKVEPSWNFTPWRSSKIHFVGSAGSWYHLVAKPGISLAGSVADERSHITNGSYIV